MSQNQFRPWQVLAACILFTTALTAHAGFFDDLGATLGGGVKKEPTKPEAAADNAPASKEPAKPETAKALDNAAPSNPTAIQKLQADFDALAKKETPEKDDWKGLYEACSGLFEIRDFSRIFNCVGIVERWHAKVGEEPINNFFGSKKVPHINYPIKPGVMLIEARAQLETGHSSIAIELAKRAYAEHKRIHQSVLDYTDYDDIFKRCNKIGTDGRCSFPIEVNLLLATALFIEGRRNESKQHQEIVEERTKLNDTSNKMDKARRLAYRTQLYLVAERYEDAVKLIEKDSYEAINQTNLLETLPFFFLNPIGVAYGLTKYTLSDAHTLPTKFQLAHIRFMAKRTEEAKKQLDELLAAPLIKTFGGIYWAALYDRGQIAEGEGKADEAIRYYTSAIDEIELQRSSINSEGARIGFFGEKQNAYQALVRLLVQTGKAEEAFLVTERSKARALVDMFANKQDFRVASADGEKLKQLLARQQSSDNLSVFNAELPAQASVKPTASTAKPDDKTAANEAANATATHIRNLKVGASKDIAALPPELASLVSVTPIKTGDILQNLAADETIVSYYYDKANLYAFLVDKQNVKSIKLQREGLEAEIEAFRQALQADGGKYDDKALALHGRLIAPLITEVKTPKLVIAPHGALHYLPFAALFDGKSYLLDRYQLTFLPSASTIKFIGKTRSEDKAGNILVLGNPDLGDAKYNLPAAENEAKSIGAIFPQSMVLLGDKASKKSLNEFGAGFKYLHFAMHGKFNSDNPLGSALMLATNSVTNVNDQLTVSELYSMKLDADMVTLSACETGLGKVSNGDDVVGLVRGFLYAGANHVISTLWEIDDKATEVLMVSFYQDIKAGKSKAGSLRNAQIALRKDYPNPRFWAAFQMTGGAEDKVRVAARD